MATSKRVAPRPSASTSSLAVGPIGTAVLIGSALCYGLGILISRGRIQWPPTQLLASLFTVAGCLALVGPLLLARRDSGDVGLGDLIWMVGGLVIWVFDAAAVARGVAQSLAWATPLGYQPMGLTILAVTLAGWRWRGLNDNWSWTNVIGWGLGLFWVGMATVTLLPPRTLGLALR